MMNWTNLNNLPLPIERALRNDTYDAQGSDFTVTKLVGSPRIVVLTEQYKEALIQDTSESVFLLLGKTLHKLLEENEDTALVEHRFFVERLGMKISGQVDRYDPETRTISDWKLSTCFSISNGIKEEWAGQLRLLALFAKENGYPVDNLEIVALARDWSKSHVGKSANYPEVPIVRIPVPMLSDTDPEAFLMERLKLHLAARERLPLCSDSDQWKQPDVFAVRSPTRKTAIRLFDTEQEADTFIATSGTGIFVERRRGKCIRCESYCPVSAFCSQWSAIRAQEVR